MIAYEKRQIILSEGQPVEVFDTSGLFLFKTNAIIGRATKTGQTEVSFEAHRKIQIIPDYDVPNGVTIKVITSKETFLAIATMVETYKGEKLATSIRMVETNANVTVTGTSETADENGNVFSAPVTKADNQPIHIQTVNAELKQYMQGILPNVQYLIYIPAIDLELLDKVTVHSVGRNIKVKVENIDYLSFPGLALLQVSTETRV
ncbi:hypothetical protein [Peribacillus frigoritolerans]|uniref:Uncharacterized protein n=1 Tax=Peribacillus castrilensis TaxID=2897690 RepID=A0AAW9NPE5_9BACI|nr:hypothetical protein [Peribacillus castrilensis]